MFKDKKIKTILIIVLLGVLFNWTLNNVGVLANSVQYIIKIFLPFIFGASFAFVLTIPINHIEKLLESKFDWSKKINRAVSLLIALILLFVIVTLLMMVIIPELLQTFDFLLKEIPNIVVRIQERATNLIEDHPIILEFIETLDINTSSLFEGFQKSFEGIVGTLSTSLMSIFGSIVETITVLFIGVTFSIYVVIAKDDLNRQSKEILYAFLPLEKADYVMHIANLSYKSFAGFLMGQGIESVVLASIIFVAMTIFRMPYAMLISVIVLLTAIIPIFGAIFASVVGVVLILTVDPWMALWFFLMFQTIQQLENNLIYPRVVGKKVGIPSIWVLFSITIGGSLMGLVGMIVSIPIFSIIYILLKEKVHANLKDKGITQQDIEEA